MAYCRFGKYSIEDGDEENCMSEVYAYAHVDGTWRIHVNTKSLGADYSFTKYHKFVAKMKELWLAEVKIPARAMRQL
jgi:hypothetical protein